MSFYPQHFLGCLEPHKLGHYGYVVVFLPEALVPALGAVDGKPVRFEGEIAEYPLQGAWQSAPGGRRYAMVSPELRQAAGVDAGDEVEVRFRIADSAAIDAPEDLAAALDAEVAPVWRALTPGKQRALATLVASAKRADTRARRVEEAIAMLRDRELRIGPRHKWTRILVG